MRLLFNKKALFFMILISHATAYSAENQVSLSSKQLHQGEVILLRIIKPDNKEPSVDWMNREVILLYRDDKKVYEGFIAADLDQKPGIYSLNIVFKSSGTAKVIPLKILEKDYGVRKLTLPDNQVNLNKEDLDRATKEKNIMDQLWETSALSSLWVSPFLMPVSGKVLSPFGRRSVINGQPRSPHTGVDLRGSKGTPVKASNNGRIMLTANHFFTGNTVVIDHGAGIMSMYFHLDQINVNKGEIISTGTTLGTVGSTGRVTGPHLHWGIRVNGQRVDPLILVALTNKMEE